MIAKLLSFLRHEQDLISRLLKMSEKQQRALIRFDTGELENIAFAQEQVINKLREAENKRIQFLMAWLKIPKQTAMNLKLSSIEKQLKTDERIAMKALRLKIRALMKKLHTFNNLNRVLANRARNSVRETLSFITNSGNHVCNVKI